MSHSPGFVHIVEQIKPQITEVTLEQLNQLISTNTPHHLIDVREDHEWDKGYIDGAIHLSKGIIERDIEKTITDKSATIVLYCGGGFRSALAADNLQKMGYSNILSLAGGYRGYKAQKGAMDNE